MNEYDFDDKPNTYTKFDKNIKKKKGSVQFQDESSQEESVQDIFFNLNRLGKIKYAELHQSANRPFEQIRPLDEEIDFCPCCNNPGYKRGYFRKFKTCDDYSSFSNCGIGIVLYFSFLKFLISVFFICTCCISIINLYFSYKYTYELEIICNNYYKINYKEYYPFIYNITDFEKDCLFYVTESKDNTTIEDSFFLDLVQ